MGGQTGGEDGARIESAIRSSKSARLILRLDGSSHPPILSPSSVTVSLILLLDHATPFLALVLLFGALCFRLRTHVKTREIGPRAEAQLTNRSDP